MHDKLELVGTKIDTKVEKKIDLNYRKKLAALTIQRLWRGFKGRSKATHQRKTNASIIIQKHIRRCLARKEA